MTIMGIDPGLATIGIAFVETDENKNITSQDYMTVTTKAKIPLPQRLNEINNDFLLLLEDYRPELAVIEQVYFSQNEKTAIDVAHARGVLLQSLAQNNIEILEVSPLQLKSAICGDGRADKKQMQEMITLMLKLNEIPQPDDAADALALAVYGSLIKKQAIF